MRNQFKPAARTEARRIRGDYVLGHDGAEHAGEGVPDATFKNALQLRVRVSSTVECVT